MNRIADAIILSMVGLINVKLDFVVTFVIRFCVGVCIIVERVEGLM